MRQFSYAQVDDAEGGIARDCKLVCVKGGEMRSNELAHLRQEQSTDGNPS
jgi:hypothetical protein